MSRQALSDDRVTALVHDAAAAPSMHNAQPWRFSYVRHSRTFELRADFERTMPHADPDTRALHLGCAAALLNLRVAVAHEGLRPETVLLPDLADRALLARVRPTDGGEGERDLGALHPAIHRRHTSRHPFEEREIPDAEGATLTFPTGWHLREVLELFREAEARNRTDRGSDQDLIRWTGGDAVSVGSAGEGVPRWAYGPRMRGGRAPMRDFAGSRPTAGRDAADFEQSPQLALVSTVHDRREDWLRAGQAMERVLLLATLHGLSASFATQPLEWTDLRWPLRDPATGTGPTQVVLRLGYGPRAPATPRRDVSRVLDIRP